MKHAKQGSTKGIGRGLRRNVLAVGVVLGVAALSACGDDDESAQDRYCAAGEDLGSAVTALADLDLIAEGTNGLEEAVGRVRDDVDTLVETADEAASDDADALEQSLSDLESALDGLAGGITADNVDSVVAAIQNVGTSAQAVTETLTDCP